MYLNYIISAHKFVRQIRQINGQSRRQTRQKCIVLKMKITIISNIDIKLTTNGEPKNS
jgi:hypothetical protein